MMGSIILNETPSRKKITLLFMFLGVCFEFPFSAACFKMRPSMTPAKDMIRLKKDAREKHYGKGCSMASKFK